MEGDQGHPQFPRRRWEETEVMATLATSPSRGNSPIPRPPLSHPKGSALLRPLQVLPWGCPGRQECPSLLTLPPREVAAASAGPATNALANPGLSHRGGAARWWPLRPTPPPTPRKPPEGRSRVGVCPRGVKDCKARLGRT